MCYRFRVPVSILAAEFWTTCKRGNAVLKRITIIKPWKNKDIHDFLKVLKREKCLDFSQKSQVEKAGFDNSMFIIN